MNSARKEPPQATGLALTSKDAPEGQPPALVRRSTAPGRWQQVEPMQYKSHDAASGRPAPFRDVSRQVLFDGDALGCELRYFEVAPGGHSTLERHEHAHAVLILRGRGRCLVGEEVHEVGEHDLVRIPSLSWHQFRADAGEALGFLCMVNRERDRPQLPDATQLDRLKRTPAVATFLGDQSSATRPEP